MSNYCIRGAVLVPSSAGVPIDRQEVYPESAGCIDDGMWEKMATITEFFDPLELTNQLLRERAQQAKVERSRQFIARENEIEVAYLSLDNRSDIDTVVLYEIFVLPPYRHQNVGTVLVRFSEGIARYIGCARVRLLPRVFDAAEDQDWLESWYLKQGYSLANDGTSEFEKNVRSRLSTDR